MRYTYLLLAFLAVLSLYSCDKEEEQGEGQLQIEFAAIGTDSEPFAYGKVYQTSLGHCYSFSKLTFYLSDIRLVEASGAEVKIQETAFIDFGDDPIVGNLSNVQALSINEIPAGNYVGLRFAIGVDSVLNHSDPAVHATDHPLSLFQGSFWTWNTGYRFLQFEGNVDADSCDIDGFDTFFQYHIGADALYTEVSTLSFPFEVVKDQNQSVGLKIDIERLFNNTSSVIDVAKKNFNHTSTDMDQAKRIMTNFSQVFSAEVE